MGIQSCTTALSLADDSCSHNLLSFSRALVQAIVRMHEQDWTHGDIKLENVVKRGLVWKLIDFGCSRHAIDPPMLGGTMVGL